MILNYFTLQKKCPYSELFWSVFSRIWTEYGETRSISPYSVRMRENTDQNNSEYGHSSRSFSFITDPCRRIVEGKAIPNLVQEVKDVKIPPLILGDGAFKMLYSRMISATLTIKKVVQSSLQKVHLEE